jgi:hypothetical protein
MEFAAQPPGEVVHHINRALEEVPDIQERRESGQCLACGESSSLWRFQDCPKVKAPSELVQVLRAAVARRRCRTQRQGTGSYLNTFT